MKTIRYQLIPKIGEVEGITKPVVSKCWQECRVLTTPGNLNLYNHVRKQSGITFEDARSHWLIISISQKNTYTYKSDLRKNQRKSNYEELKWSPSKDHQKLLESHTIDSFTAVKLMSSTYTNQHGHISEN